MKNIIFNKTKSFIGRSTSDHACQIQISEVCDLGHVGHVTYSFINRLFISTGIFDDKLCPQMLSVGTTANSHLSLYNVYINIIYLNLPSILATA
jgi:hypothetical protein